MDSLEWEVFKRTGEIGHYLLMREAEEKKILPVEFAEEFFE